MIRFFLGVLKRIVAYFIVAVLIVAAGFAFGPSFISQESYKQFLAAKVNEATGKNLVIRGEVKISTIPHINIGISDAVLTDPASGKSTTITSFTAIAGIGSFLMGNVDATGHIRWQEQTLNYHAFIRQFNRLFVWQPAPVIFRLDHAPYTLEIEGMLQTSSNFRRLALAEAIFTLNGMRGRAGMVVNMEENVPTISAKMGFETLDIDALQSLIGAPLYASAPGAKTPPAVDLKAKWSTEPLPLLAAIPALNADIGIRVEHLTYQKQPTGQGVNIGILMQDKQTNLSLNADTLFNGPARCILSLDRSGKQPALASELELANTDIGALLHTGWNIDWLEGVGNASLILESKGSSLQDILNALAGRGTLHMEAGKIKNIGVLWGGGNQAADITDLNANFTLVKGVVANNDFLARTPLSRLRGAGKADLARQRVEYTFLWGAALPIGEFGPMPATPIAFTGNLLQPDIKVNLKQLSTMTGSGALGKSLKKLDTFRQVKDQLDTMSDDFQKEVEKQSKKTNSKNRRAE